MRKIERLVLCAVTAVVFSGSGVESSPKDVCLAKSCLATEDHSDFTADPKDTPFTLLYTCDNGFLRLFVGPQPGCDQQWRT